MAQVNQRPGTMGGIPEGFLLGVFGNHIQHSSLALVEKSSPRPVKNQDSKIARSPNLPSQSSETREEGCQPVSFYLCATQSHYSMVSRPKEAHSQTWERSYRFDGSGGGNWAACHPRLRSEGRLHLTVDRMRRQQTQRLPRSGGGGVSRTPRRRS